MLQRGIEVSYESIRRWCLKFGQTIANELRRRHRRPNRKWHLDEVRLKINGEVVWLWRAVDSEGNVLDILALNLVQFALYPKQLLHLLIVLGNSLLRLPLRHEFSASQNISFNCHCSEIT